MGITDKEKIRRKVNKQFNNVRNHLEYKTSEYKIQYLRELQSLVQKEMSNI